MYMVQRSGRHFKVPFDFYVGGHTHKKKIIKMAENILWKRQWLGIKMGHRRDFYPIVHGTIYILGDCARPKLDEEQPQMMRFWKNTCFLLPFKKPGKYSGFKSQNNFSFLRNGSDFVLDYLTSSPKIPQHRRCLWCLNGWCWVLVHFVVRVASNGQRPQKPFDADYVYFS